MTLLDETLDQAAALDTTQRRDKDAGLGVRGCDGDDGEFQRISTLGSDGNHVKIRVFGNLLLHTGRHAPLEVRRQIVQGVNPFLAFRPHIHVNRIHRKNSHHHLFAIDAVYPVIPYFVIRGVPVRIKGNVGVLILHMMLHKPRLGHMLEVIGTGHYRHAAKQNEHHQGSQKQKPIFFHKQAIS